MEKHWFVLVLPNMVATSLFKFTSVKIKLKNDSKLKVKLKIHILIPKWLVPPALDSVDRTSPSLQKVLLNSAG